jgi:lysophospholipase L1-like esterase
MEINGFRKAYAILLLAAGWLLLYPLVQEQIPYLKSNFRTYNAWKAIQHVPPSAQNHFIPVKDWAKVPQFTHVQNFKTNPDLGIRLLVAPDRLEAEDSLYLSMESYDPGGDYNGIGFLQSFFQQLATGKSQVRIAYFGDSSIEGDLISQSFRDSLQLRFGGNGVGFVGINNPIPGFRQSVKLDFSKNWYRGTVAQKNPGKMPFGISGEFFRAASPGSGAADSTVTSKDTLRALANTDQTRWTRITTTNTFAGAKIFQQARLFYGRPLRDSFPNPIGKIKVNANGQQLEYSLSASNLVNSKLLLDAQSTRIQVNFKIPATLPIFGISVESPTGVIVDNFSMRGNSGRALMKIQSEVMKQFQEQLQYDLIILQYGLNVINPKLHHYEYYEKEMLQLIQYFQENFPGVAILLVGPSDKASRLDGVLMTDPSIPRITNAMRRAAQTTGVGYFSMYEAMGGAGSMMEWVNNRQPRLANLDYTHFNSVGAKVASSYLFRYIMDGYEQYAQKKIQ